MAAVFGMAVAGFGSVPFVDAARFRESIAPGVTIAGIPVGGQTPEQAKNALAEKAGPLENNLPLRLAGEDRSVSKIAALDTEAVIGDAMRVGRGKSGVADIADRARARLFGWKIDPRWTFDEQAFAPTVTAAFADRLQGPRNASFSVTFTDNLPVVSVTAAQSGDRVNTERALATLRTRLAAFSREPISLETLSIDPEITAEELNPLRGSVEQIVQSPEITLSLEEKSWTIKKEDIASWLRVRATDSGPVLDIDRGALESFLAGIAKTVDHPSKNPVFELDDTGLRVKTFIPPRDGLTIVAKDNTEKIAKLILENAEKRTLALAVSTAPPKISLADTNTLGIRERLSAATTNFKGSPANRIKNIKRGAALLNGILIAPGEEFSLLESLRPFTLENGYLSELVIKAAEGRTVPEIGGGLCQIGTTMFRTVMNAGLPVTVRQNHSYRVSYYEPPVGMDATIYDPAPDFKFINNTGGHLLLTTKVEGLNITFELWGTPDGRRVELSKPVVTNITSPPPKKIIETLNLKPGQTKCTEKPHNGADAIFTYKVFSPDGTVSEREFKSRYRPWREVCLVGVEKLSVPEPPPEPVEAPTTETGVPLEISQ